MNGGALGIIFIATGSSLAEWQPTAHKGSIIDDTSSRMTMNTTTTNYNVVWTT